MTFLSSPQGPHIMPKYKHVATHKQPQTSFATRDFNSLIRHQNKLIDKESVLSSGRAIPSDNGWNDLALHCDIAYRAMQRAEKNLADRLPGLMGQREALAKRYAKDPTRLIEEPAYYTAEHAIKTLELQVKSAIELYNELTSRYKRSTGNKWAPRANVNEPIKEIKHARLPRNRKSNA